MRERIFILFYFLLYAQNYLTFRRPAFKIFKYNDFGDYFPKSFLMDRIYGSIKRVSQKVSCQPSGGF